MVNFISLESSRNQISGRASTFYLIELIIHLRVPGDMVYIWPRMRCDRVGTYAEFSENMSRSFIRMKPVDLRRSCAQGIAPFLSSCLAVLKFFDLMLNTAMYGRAVIEWCPFDN